MAMSMVSIWVAACLFGFWRWGGPRAAVPAYLAGWLLLPVGLCPEALSDEPFPFWLTGTAVPSEMLWTKAAGIPVVVLLCALALDRRAWRGLRPHAMDLWMAAWCLWPLVQGLVPGHEGATLAPWQSAAHLAATWGCTWCLGRMYCSRASDRQASLVALAWAGAACLPWTLLEGFAGWQSYGALFEPHPFRFDGAERHLGYRPLGFFENGNQFGLWASLCPLAGLIVWRCPGGAGHRLGVGLVLGVAFFVALSTQSVGALLLAALGWGLVAARPVEASPLNPSAGG